VQKDHLRKRIAGKSHEEVSKALFKSAMCSMEHALQHYRDKDDKHRTRFAVLHVFHSLELILKSLLARENKHLILSNLDRPSNHTVSVDIACNRLALLTDVAFSQRDIEAINHIRDWRNDLEHFLYEGDARNMQYHLEYLICLWWALVKKHTDYADNLLLNSDSLREVIEIDRNHNVLYRAAKDRLGKYMNSLPPDRVAAIKIELCVECMQETRVVDLSADETNCFYCNDSELIGECDACGEREVLYRDFDGKSLCSHCSSPDRLPDVSIDDSIYQERIDNTADPGDY
jgi:hypothetical protein